MLKFSDLSVSQKRFVVAFVNELPHVKEDPHVSLKECAAVYYGLRDQRTGVRGEKIGYPNWLFASNKVERGIYQLPVPTDAEVTAFTQELAQATPVAKAKAKVAKLAKTKTVKAKATKAPTATKSMDISRLENIVNSAAVHDQDVAEFEDILRANGIEV
jgi:hypothetical protein